MACWLPLALPLYALVPNGNWASIITLTVLYTEFVVLLQAWGRYVHHQPSLIRYLGLDRSRQNGFALLAGLGMGGVGALSVFVIQGWLGWLVWQPSIVPLGRLVAEALLMALLIGFAEELLFRGWLLSELERDYCPTVALWVNAIAFAAVHVRLLAFPVLVLLGVSLVLAKRFQGWGWRGRLGLPIGLHAGLVWGNYLVDVGKLVRYTGQVPAWITGIDRNPLMGVVGVVFFSLLTLMMYGLTRWRCDRAL
jgi:hypothetical protein